MAALPPNKNHFQISAGKTGGVSELPVLTEDWVVVVIFQGAGGIS